MTRRTQRIAAALASVNIPVAISTTPAMDLIVAGHFSVEIFPGLQMVNVVRETPAGFRGCLIDADDLLLFVAIAKLTADRALVARIANAL